MDRFSSKEDAPEWATGPFDDGSKARIDGRSIDTAPSADVIGVFARKSWIAGWVDADAGILADGLCKQMPVHQN